MFPYGEDPYKYTYLRDFSHIEISLIRVNRRAQNISIWGFFGDHLSHVDATWLCYPFPLCPFNWNPSIMESQSVFLPLRSGHDLFCPLFVNAFRPFLSLVPSLMDGLIKWIRLPQILSLSVAPSLYGSVAYFYE